jgi:uncharacterized RDD family membrane protein YckC
MNNNPTNPYAAPTAVVDDIAEPGSLELAGRGRRLGAAIIDSLIIAIPFMLLGVWFAIAGARSGAPAAGGVLTWVVTHPFGYQAAASLLGYLTFLALNGYLLNKSAQTIGKRLLGIRIVRSNGETADFGRIAFLRYLPTALVQMLPLVGNFYPLIDALLIFRGSRKCLHDNIADTIVVNV